MSIYTSRHAGHFKVREEMGWPHVRNIAQGLTGVVRFPDQIKIL
jgi:hypothetical protein